jgi:hypothetical protein
MNVSLKKAVFDLKKKELKKHRITLAKKIFVINITALAVWLC